MFRVGVANGTRINGVGVGWIDDDAVDVPSLFKPHPFPGGATVDGFIDTLTQTDGVTWVTFTRSYPNGSRIGLLYRNGTDIEYGLLVEY